MRKGLKFTLSFLFVSILTLNSCLNIKENIVVFGKLENGEQVYKYLLKNNDCEVEVIHMVELSQVLKCLIKIII